MTFEMDNDTWRCSTQCPFKKCMVASSSCQSCRSYIKQIGNNVILCKKENYYVRFGKIPKSEHSGIYRSDERKVGEEIGISCYHAIVNSNTVSCILSLNEMNDMCVYNLSDNAINGYKYVKDKTADVEKFKDEDDIPCVKENFPVYLITGKEIDCGSSGEPLLNNVIILTELEVAGNYLAFKEYKNEIC
jgi:hypothetical protein